MSVTRQQLSNKTYDQKNFYPLTMLSLNDIFRESMRKMQQLFPRVHIIVRCESLPVIKGNQQDISQAFEEMIELIFLSSDTISQLFLYIDCEDEEHLSEHAIRYEGFKNYTIKFRTNIFPNGNWEEANKELLARCRLVFSLHNAKFQVNTLNHTGFLFLISVPGKI
jgi:hypothetical protein